MQPTLSIVIPTLDIRIRQLAGTMEQIQAQAKGIESDVEVEVSSNIVPYVPYDINCLRALKLATGKYIWLMADDDEIIPESIPRIVDLLNMYPEMRCIYIDQRNLKPKTNHPMEFAICEESPPFPLDLTFGGSILIRKDVFDSLQLKEAGTHVAKGNNENDQLFYGFLHSYIFLEAMRRGPYGVEPYYGIKAIASSGQVTAQNWLLRELMMTNYWHQVNKYGGLLDKRIYDFYSGIGFWKRYMTMLAIRESRDSRPATRGRNREVCEHLYHRYKMVLIKSGRPLEELPFYFMDTFAKTIAGRIMIGILHRMMRKKMLRTDESEADAAEIRFMMG